MLYNLQFTLGALLLMTVSTTVPAYIAKAVLTPKPPPEVVKHTTPRVVPKEVHVPIKNWRKK